MNYNQMNYNQIAQRREFFKKLINYLLSILLLLSTLNIWYLETFTLKHFLYVIIFFGSIYIFCRVNFQRTLKETFEILKEWFANLYLPTKSDELINRVG